MTYISAKTFAIPLPQGTSHLTIFMRGMSVKSKIQKNDYQDRLLRVKLNVVGAFDRTHAYTKKAKARQRLQHNVVASSLNW